MYILLFLVQTSINKCKLVLAILVEGGEARKNGDQSQVQVAIGSGGIGQCCLVLSRYAYVRFFFPSEGCAPE